MNRDILLFIAIGALAIAATGAGVYLMARGIRNNNPGNIRHGPSKWQGMSAEQTDDDYIQFDNPVYGIRAMARLLQNYQANYELDTITGIISRWAPAHENPTAAYIENVSRIVGVLPNQRINVADRMELLIKAIIRQENGQQPYSTETINQGIALA